MSTRDRVSVTDGLGHAAYVAACHRRGACADDMCGQCADIDEDLTAARERYFHACGTAEGADDITESAFRVCETLDRWNREMRP